MSAMFVLIATACGSNGEVDSGDVLSQSEETSLVEETEHSAGGVVEVRRRGGVAGV